MDIDLLRTELEQTHTRRVEEIRFFRNLAGFANLSDEETVRHLRAVCVVLYAQFEGYCKDAFCIYIGALNREGKVAKELRSYLLAAAMKDAFDDLHSDRIPGWLPAAVADDPVCRRVARRAEFLEQLWVLREHALKLDEEETLTTSANYRPRVVRGIMFALGVDPTGLSIHESALDQLVELRNDYAHGRLSTKMTTAKYERLQEGVFETMREIKKAVIHAAKLESHLASFALPKGGK